jgi:indolepyruvate ferredoxin oxidoreductase, beta subunit
LGKIDVFMAGVGGQGVILASDSLAEVAMRAGFDVKKSDALGMAQRGGSVVSHIRIGPKVFAPLIKKGEADFLLGFERLEAARCADNLSPNGLAIINDQELPPLSMLSGSIAYPDQKQVERLVSQYTKRIAFVPGLKIAKELGNPRVAGVVLLGFLSIYLPIEEALWKQDIAERVAAKVKEINLQAFAQGRQQAEIFSSNHEEAKAATCRVRKTVRPSGRK